MLIKKVRLHNIRSYVDAEICFNEGKTLIAGDIGSGKSTILLAIEFALFGFIKGDISGSMLLRHGWNEGFVELAFHINNHEIIIRRTLKRTSNSIVQDGGFVVKNNVRENLTPTELKAKILELLGYPEDLMTKSKSLIYRYTVYTPQEEMKNILFGNSEERLNIIRRIFGIDKYKRVKENCDVYAKHLREELRELAGRTFDFEEKKSRLKLFEIELVAAENDVLNILPVLSNAKSVSNNCRLALDELEQKKLRLLDVKKQRDFCIVSLQQFQNENLRLESEQKELTERTSVLKAEFNSNLVDNSAVLKQLISEKKTELLLLDKERTSLISKIANAVAFEKISSELVRKVQFLDTCPLCLQKVSDEHKNSIITNESSKILVSQGEHKNNVFLQSEIDKKIVLIKSEIDNLLAKEKNAELLLLKQQHVVEYDERIYLIANRISQIKIESGQLLEKKSLCEQKISELTLVDDEYAKIKSSLDVAFAEEKKVEILLSVAREKKSNAEKNKLVLEKEVLEKEVMVNKMFGLKKTHDWLRDAFYPLVELIEKQVLARVYWQFNELFQQWFVLLVDDEMFSARLDYSFAPVLQQNGFDTFAENLSGGEKTACGLAYRLALNRVINDVMTLVQTKDLLILDEPTDGFSDEQLDRVRDVLNVLALKQVIVVSHERKVEGFVDCIINVHKQAHITVVGERFI